VDGWGREGKGREGEVIEGEGKWYPHFFGESYAAVCSGPLMGWTQHTSRVVGSADPSSGWKSTPLDFVTAFELDKSSHSMLQLKLYAMSVFRFTCKRFLASNRNMCSIFRGMGFRNVSSSCTVTVEVT